MKSIQLERNGVNVTWGRTPEDNQILGEEHAIALDEIKVLKLSQFAIRTAERNL